MPDEKHTVVTPDDSVMIAEQPLGGDGRPATKPLRIAAMVLKACQIAGMALVVFLMFLTVAHVIGRYVFDYPMLGVVEVSGLMVVTLVFFAAPYDFLIDRHIAVDVIVRRLPRKASTIVNVITYIISLVMITLALIWTIKQGIKISGSGARSDILHIPDYPFYFVVAFGWFLCLCAVAARVLLFLQHGRLADSVGGDTPVDTTGKAAKE